MRYPGLNDLLMIRPQGVGWRATARMTTSASIIEPEGSTPIDQDDTAGFTVDVVADQGNVTAAQGSAQPFSANSYQDSGRNGLTWLVLMSANEWARTIMSYLHPHVRELPNAAENVKA